MYVCLSPHFFRVDIKQFIVGLHLDDKSGGITYDIAAFVFSTKNILKIRSRPQSEPGSDHHYLVRMTGLEPAREAH